MGATPDDVRKGRKRLKALLPSLRALARKQHSEGMEAHSGLAESVMPFLTSENSLDSLMIYREPNGGWSADVLLKGVPPGYPDTLGTPLAHPLGSEADALKAGRGIVVSLLRLIENRKGAQLPVKEPVFLLHGLEVQLSSAMFKALKDALGGTEQYGYGSPEAARKRIDEVVDHLMPGGTSLEAMQALSDDDRSMLISVLHMATVSGIHRHPQTIATSAPTKTRH